MRKYIKLNDCMSEGLEGPYTVAGVMLPDQLPHPCNIDWPHPSRTE